jgi:hypothetical protein
MNRHHFLHCCYVIARHLCSTPPRPWFPLPRPLPTCDVPVSRSSQNTGYNQDRGSKLGEEVVQEEERGMESSEFQINTRHPLLAAHASYLSTITWATAPLGPQAQFCPLHFTSHVGAQLITAVLFVSSR